MALNVKSRNKGSLIGILDYKNQDGTTEFTLDPGVRKIVVYRNAGIIYENDTPDGYAVTTSGSYITKVTLNTAMADYELLQINEFS